MKLNKKSIIIPIAFMVLIIILSSLPVDYIKDQIKHRYGLFGLLKAKVEGFFKMDISFSQIQNIMHFPFFAVLAFLWMMFFDKRQISVQWAIIYTLTITMFFAGLDEFMQHFIPDRDASFLDLFINFLGCLTGIFSYIWLKADVYRRRI